MYERVQRFTDEELSKLHDATVRVFKEIGVAFHDEPEALEIFKAHGFKVDGETVFIDEKHLQKALETAPSEFTIAGRDPKKSVTVGGKNLVLCPGYGCALMVTETGEQRKGLVEDYQNLCKLVQTSKVINMNGMIMIEPSDVPPEVAYLDMLYSNIVFCDKPFLGSCETRQAAIDAIEMAGIAWGGKDKIKDKPVTMPIISSLSPLQYTGHMAGAIIEYARHGQPILFGLLVMAGATGPVTLTGTLVQQNVEMLAGVVLAQLVKPGVPVVYGGTSSIADMRTGALSVGAPEMAILQNPQAQMARFYGLPCRGSGGLTDTHFPDIQAGIESALGLMSTIMSGSNFILHAVGIMDSYLAMSYEKFLIDEEICAMLIRMLRPMEVSDEAIQFDVMKEVGPGGEFLTHAKTLELCRSEFFVPELATREDHATWKAGGRKTMDQRATQRLAERLAAYEKPDIDPSIERDLAQYVAKRKAR